MKRHIWHSSLLTAIVSVTVLVSPAARAVVVDSGAFGSGAIVESFEGIGYVNPVGMMPLDFGSGVVLTGGARGDTSGTQIVDFSPPSGFFGFHTIAHIPTGTAFLGHGNPGFFSTTELTFDEPVLRVGAYITSSNLETGRPFILTAYDSGGAFLESAMIDPVPTADWRMNFLGIQNSAGVRKITVVSTTGGGALMLDDLTFQTIPEPSSLVLLGVGFLTILSGQRRSQRL